MQQQQPVGILSLHSSNSRGNAEPSPARRRPPDQITTTRSIAPPLLYLSQGIHTIYSVSVAVNYTGLAFTCVPVYLSLAWLAGIPFVFRDHSIPFFSSSSTQVHNNIHFMRISIVLFCDKRFHGDSIFFPSNHTGPMPIYLFSV